MMSSSGVIYLEDFIKKRELKDYFKKSTRIEEERFLMESWLDKFKSSLSRIEHVVLSLTVEYSLCLSDVSSILGIDKEDVFKLQNEIFKKFKLFTNYKLEKLKTGEFYYGKN